MDSNWRDCDAWRKENLNMNTTSNEACKLFDVCLSQIVKYKENEQFGGLVTSLNSMISSDPDFILGHCLKNGIELLGSNALLNSKDSFENIHNLINNSKKQEKYLTKRELLHVKAISLLQNGALIEASNCWEDILIEYPNDIMAIKFAHSVYFYQGASIQTRDSIARVLPYWNDTMPYYSYLYGMYAFGLVESNQFSEAKKNALKGLELEKTDAWSTHALCHMNEYSGEFDYGEKFLLSTESNWSPSNFIAEHNYWHLGLFYLEQNKREEAIGILNDKLMKSESSLDLINSSSLLLRLKLDSNSNEDFLNDKWTKLKESFKSRIEEHGYMLVDFHVALVLGSCGSDEEKEIFLNSLKKFINSEDFLEQNDSNSINYLRDINKELANQLFNSIFHFNENNFDEVVNLLYPIRYKLFKIGGSRAQRDIISQILIHSALRSNSEYNKKIGQALLNERISLIPNSKLTERIAIKYFV